MPMRSALAVVLLVLAAAPAFAQQRVVILEFEGDKGTKLRQQVEKALKKANTVDVVPIAKWKDLAGKKKLKGQNAMTPAAVAKLSKGADVDAAVEGAIGAKFSVRILDNAGNELWSKDLPLKKGLLSDDHAKKLAKAITAAAKTAPPRESEEEAKPKEKDEPVAEEPTKPEKKEPEAVDPDQPRRPGDLSAEEREKRRREEEAEANSATDVREPIVPERDSDLDNEGRKAKVRPFKIVRVWLAGTTTWRSYCSRPGVLNCKDYDTKDPKPAGDTVDFSPQVPYAGFLLDAQVFPLVAFSDNKYASGLMLQGSFSLGFSLTKVRVTSPSGETPEKDVVSTDRGWSAEIGYRFPFVFGSDSSPLVAYVGPRIGVASRVFEIDAKAMVPLPGSYRVFPQFGLDAAVPLGSKYARLEVGFTYFLNPKPGPDEIVGYGNLEDPSGGGRAAADSFSFEGGLGGEVWGPIGYTLRFRYIRFHDQFFGQGKKWTRCDDTQCGGAAEESYAGLFWGITASF